MRFAFYYPGATGGHSGVVAAIAAWVRALLAAGHEVAVLHAGRPPTEPRYGDADLRAVRHVGRGRPTLVPVDLAAALRDTDVLVLNEAWFIANLVAARAARHAGVPYVVIPHGVYDPAWINHLKPPRAPRRALESAVLRSAAAVHAFFPAEAAHARLLEPSVRSVVAPMGFELPEDRWQPGGDYLAWYGRYAVAHKGLELMLRALAVLPAGRRPPLRMHGIDYEGGFGRTRELVAELGLADHVTVAGPIFGARKRDFVLGCAGFVQPSNWDSIPITVAENLALGVPCLVSDRINPAPYLAAEDAAVVTSLDQDALAAALAEFPGRGAAYSERGRAFVAKHFDWADIVPSYLDQISAVLGVRA
ncbi:glycosyltransferase [Actinokineospora xionganensis]|uniref:Glycosyltransferase n=1 Tax=Actinokineospora xionganensis TaxID=2684470 RepID=A0ABR7L5U2_9PSEU|nr:glycosyltransferase [Actinokineospora xionganensis]MBC6447999.1 glycosyltransferase [Actinokineospora xionganensis]